MRMRMTWIRLLEQMKNQVSHKVNVNVLGIRQSTRFLFRIRNRILTRND